MFFIGIALSGRTFVGYIWMNGSLRVKDASTVTIILFFAEGFSIVFASLYFQYFSKDWRGIYTIPLVPLTIATFMMFNEKDAPKFYYGIGDYEKTR
jgi:hypothetical protein